jgi:hypothetical protein
LSDSNYPSFELAWNFLSIHCHNLHGGPHETAEGVIFLFGVVFICKTFRIG